MEISIKGAQKASLIDYPGKICTVVFVSRCNFRCPFCHNPELVLDEVKEDISPNEMLKFFESKKGWIDGVCITGGEPTLHRGTPDFARAVKALGLLVKLDTNGTNPQMLRQMIDEKLVDYIAMDIKADREGYEKAAGSRVNMDAVEKSICMIKDSGIEYEFRTTIVPGLFSEKTAENIAEWLKGSKKFCLQQFRSADRTLDSSYQNIGHFHIDELEKFAEIIRKKISNVEIRGV